MNLPLLCLLLASLPITLEYATTPSERSQGLSERIALRDDHGMVFVFPNEKIRSFWMKGCYLDLSIAFLDRDKRILAIQQMKAYPDESDAFYTAHSVISQQPIRYAVEMPAGWFVQHGVKVGDYFEWTATEPSASVVLDEPAAHE